MSEVIRTLAPRFIRVARGLRRLVPAALAAHHRPRHHRGRLPPAHRAGPPHRRDRPALQRQVRFHRRRPEHPRGARQQHRAEHPAGHPLRAGAHDLAEGLQQAMLPRRIPDVPGAHIAVRYRSGRLGRDIGGDWYDIIRAARRPGRRGHRRRPGARHPRRRRHGPAAHRAARLRAAGGHTPATAMARASVFLQELDTDRFATCTYMEVDLASGVVQVVRAATWTRCCGRPTATAAASPSRAACRSACPPSSAHSTTP